MSKENWLKNPWIVGIGLLLVTPVFTALGSLIFDFIKQIPFLTTIKSWWGIIVSFLSLEIKIWWVLVWVIVTSTIKAIQIEVKNRKYSNSTEKKDTKKANYLNYKTDVLKEWMWEWEWEFNIQSLKTEITNLMPVCPKCKTTLKDSYDGYKCIRCDFELSSNSSKSYEYKNDIKHLIEDNIKKNNYPSAPSI